LEHTGLFQVESVATADLDKEVVVSYAAIHCGLTNELIESYENYPSKEEMAAELTAKRLGYDFKNDKPYDWYKLSRKKDKTKGIEKYWLADHLSHNLGDMMQIDALPDCDFLTYSCPCFTADTLVLTNNGLKKIVDITTNDKVLTHNNEYKEVLDSKCTGEKNIYIIDAMCSNKIECTGNHKFLVREMYRTYPTYNNGKRGNVRHFKDPEWIECEKLSQKHYLGMAINQKSILPQWDGIDFVWSDGRKTRHKNNIQSLISNHSFWWTVGRWIGDGWVRESKNSNEVIICCSKEELNEILPHLENCNIKYNVSEERTVYKIRIPSKEFCLFLNQFGKGAPNKKIPGFVYDLPIEYLKDLLDGYISADGYFVNNKYKVTSVSKELIYGIGQIVAKVYKRPFSIYRVKRNPIVYIEGRKCNQKDSWDLAWKPEIGKQDKAFYENGYIWFPIRNIKRTDKIEKVYDITVKDDHSFMANGCIVHNCTDLSIAGHQEGLKWTCQDCGHTYDPAAYSVEERYLCPVCGSKHVKSTRSGLLYEVERLLVTAKQNGSLPKYLLMENVDALVSKKYIDSFNNWLERLDNLGYHSYYQVINAKNAGVPQNRKRIFVFSILKEIDTGKFTFPVSFDNGIRLKDVLENTVEERYYLSDEKVASFLGNLIKTEDENTVSIKQATKDGYIKCDLPGVADLSYPESTTRRGRVQENGTVSPTLTAAQTGICKLEKITTTRGAEIASCVRASYFKNGNRNIEENIKSGKGYEGIIEKYGCDKSHNSPQIIERANCITAKEDGDISNHRAEGTAVIEKIGNINPSGKGINGNVFGENGLAPTLTTNKGEGPKIAISSDTSYITPYIRIRKLTPKECHRLMGFDDIDVDRCKAVGMSDAQGYKQAGNSIVTNVIALIAEHFYKAQYDESYECLDEKMENFQKPQME
jgi:DNA-cytosine methyltransferase